MLQRTFSSLPALTLIAFIGVWSTPQTAFAQGLFGGGGATTQAGGSSFGGSSGLTRSATSASGFTSQFGGTNSLGGQTGAGALNTSGLGQQTNGMAGPQISTQLGELSQTIGQGGFVGGSDTAGRFVGNVQAGQQSIQATQTGTAGRGGQFGGGQFGNRGGSTFNQQSGFNQGGAQGRRVVRPRLQIAFEHPRPATTAVQTNLNSQFTRLRTSRPELQGVQIQMGDDREVVLRGRVDSENDKKLAAMLARLEPGVRTVKNEITIAGE